MFQVIGLKAEVRGVKAAITPTALYTAESILGLMPSVLGLQSGNPNLSHSKNSFSKKSGYPLSWAKPIMNSMWIRSPLEYCFLTLP